MKIFLCWSRDRGQRLAEALKEWLVGVVPGVTGRDVFFSPDIGKGSDWFDEVRSWLAQVNAAVICLTPENVQSPWMHFEAGVVLGRVGKECVFPYLLGVRPEDLKGPLASFQATVNDEKDTRRLAEALCEIAGAEVPPDYGEHWLRLRDKMEGLGAGRLSDVIPDFATLFQRKTFDEPLNECTDQTWAVRFAGARETVKVLEKSKELVGRVCEPRQTELFNRLVSTVDGYASLIKEKLLAERRFADTEAGQVDFTRTPDGSPYPPGATISATAERRRRQIKELVRQLDAPGAEVSAEGEASSPV